MAGLKWIVIAEILLDSGVEYISSERVRRGSIVYSGTCLSFGSIERSIPVPSGMPHVSQARIRIADPFRKWRNLFSSQTPRRRIMQLTLMPENASIADYDPVFIGEVVDVEFPPASIEITLNDRTFSWLDETLPVVRDFDPGAIDGDAVFPIVSGLMRSVVTPAHGVIALPHIGNAAIPSMIDPWGVAMHPIHDLVAVYREEDIDVDGNRAFVLVDPAEYSLIQGARTVFGVATHPTYLDFLVLQPEGTLIRADIDGINYRGDWGTLGEVGRNSTASPPYGTSVALRNPIDFFINLTYLIMSKAGESLDAFDAVDIAALRAAIDGILFCDGAIAEQMTGRALIGRFNSNFNFDMFAKRNGKITLAFTDATDAGRPVFKEGKHILRESFSERLPAQISNLIVAQYEYNNATDSFEASESIEIEDVSAFPDASPKVEKEVWSNYFARDLGTVEAIALLRNRCLSLGSFRQTFRLPAPAVMDDLELGKLVGITHSMGLATNGYTNKEVKIVGLSLNLDRLEYTVDSILRVPQTIVRPDIEILFEGEGELRVLNLGSGLVLWLEAEGMGYADDDEVLTWLDKSGELNDAFQATAGKYPLCKTDIVNGLDVVRFDGVDDFLTVVDNASIDLTQLHLFVVCRPSSIGNNTVVSKPSNSTWIDPYARYFLGFRPTDRMLIWNCNYTSGQSFSPASSVSTSVFKLYESWYVSPDQSVWINGVQVVSATPGQGAIPASDRDLAIGTSNTTDPGEYFAGDIAAIMLFNDNGNVAAIREYLRVKYDLY